MERDIYHADRPIKDVIEGNKIKGREIMKHITTIEYDSACDKLIIRLPGYMTLLPLKEIFPGSGVEIGCNKNKKITEICILNLHQRCPEVKN
jgi:hypothetical protein